jgi:hypothetical protein
MPFHLIGIVLAFSYVLCVLGYGFSFPRGSDYVYTGQTINITWDSVDGYINLWLIREGYVYPVHSTPPFAIAGNVLDWLSRQITDIFTENISNQGYYHWTVPTDLDNAFLLSYTYIKLQNSLTEEMSFDTEYLYIAGEKPSTNSTSVSTWARFPAPTGSPYESLIDGSLINITWDTEVDFVNLSYHSDVNQPWVIISQYNKPFV